MAEKRRFDDVYKPRQNETSETEHERVRSSNDRDQEMEREGESSRHNRGYDEAVEGRASDEEAFEDAEDVDPDSADADIDRDDSATD